MPRYATSSPARMLPVGLLLTPLARAADDIRDLRGAKAMPGQLPLALILAALLVLALAVYIFVRWRRHRRAPLAPSLSPADAALARLDAARALLGPSQAREFCDAVSDVVRQYIESQFAVPVQQQTTEEFLQQLTRAPVAPLAPHREALTDFLQRCDFVRFSGTATGVSNLEALFATARRFVVDTAGGTRDPLPAA